MYPDPLDLFLKAVRDHAGRPAVVVADETLTYATFGDRTARIAAALSQCGLEHPRILIHLPQGADAYAAMFATLMAGGYYCPINLEHPVARRQSVLSLFDPDIVITGPDSALGELNLPARTRSISVLALAESDPLPTPRAPHDLAYVIFTSGSTGEPKGVTIGRQGLGHYVSWAHNAMHITPKDRWSQHPNIAFDLSVLDIYGALCAGAALVPIVGRKARLLPAMVARDQKLTIWNSVPSVIDQIRRGRQLTPEMLQSVRLMTFCGEPLLEDQLEAIFSVRPDMVVHNTYGPTEATVSCTLAVIPQENFHDYCRQSVALGDAIGDMRIDLADGRHKNEGEVVISGPQVSLGYWKRPDLTNLSFEIPGEGQPGTRSYRTGDWAERREGKLFFVERLDRQAKRAGYRIELGDIDAAARAVTGTVAATVLVDGHICTFIEGAAKARAAEIMVRIREVLPAYSIPDEIVYIDALPRSANDKIDVGALEGLLQSRSQIAG